jgi:hypothetical protein
MKSCRNFGEAVMIIMKACCDLGEAFYMMRKSSPKLKQPGRIENNSLSILQGSGRLKRPDPDSTLRLCIFAVKNTITYAIVIFLSFPNWFYRQEQATYNGKRFFIKHKYLNL